MPVILEARDLTKTYPLGRDDGRGPARRVADGRRRRVRRADGPVGLRASRRCSSCSAASTGRRRATVILEGETISELSDDEATRLRRDRTGFVFQSFNLIPLLDVTENVALPFTIAGAGPVAGRAARARSATSSSSST